MVAALSGGRGQDAGLALSRVQRDSAEFKGAVAIGREVGVRWISVDAGPSSVVVSWYQDLIPMRLQCTRGTNAPTVADQKKIAEEMQKRAFETVPYIPTAQFIIPTAYRTNLSGVIVSPVTFLWNVEKK